MTEKFAFESGEVSIVFYSTYGLGDAVVARKVFEALIELVPNCVADFLCVTEAHRKYAEAFYGDIKNLNRLLNRQEYNEHFRKYDLALCVGGCHAIFFDHVNTERLQSTAPALTRCLKEIDRYNRQNVYERGDWRESVAFRNMIAASILGKNFSWFLSCAGALPIRDDVIKIPLKPEFKPQFDALKLGRYITVYNDIPTRERERPKVKTWPVRYWHEYVARMKKSFPKLTVIQCGGGIFRLRTPTVTSLAATLS